MTALPCTGCESRDERRAACPTCAAAILATELRPGMCVTPLHQPGLVYTIAGRPRITHTGVVVVDGHREGAPLDGEPLLWCGSAELTVLAP